MGAGFAKTREEDDDGRQFERQRLGSDSQRSDPDRLSAPIKGEADMPRSSTALKTHRHQGFLHDTCGGKDRTCSSCHTAAGHGPTVTPNGGHFPSLDAAATHFPRYNARAGKVITLQDQVRACVTGALAGKPPAADSVTMTDLVSYLTSLSQGKPMAMGQ
jgi:thiosulfate dehydrogenase